MKNKIIIAAIAVAAVATACRKERTCDCTITSSTTFNGVKNSTTQTWKVTEDKQKKSEFKHKHGCYSWTSTQTYTTGTVVENNYDCKLD